MLGLGIVREAKVCRVRGLRFNPPQGVLSFFRLTYVFCTSFFFTHVRTGQIATTYFKAFKGMPIFKSEQDKSYPWQVKRVELITFLIIMAQAINIYGRPGTYMH